MIFDVCVLNIRNTRGWPPSSLLYSSFNKQFTKRRDVHINTSALYLESQGLKYLR